MKKKGGNKKNTHTTHFSPELFPFAENMLITLSFFIKISLVSYINKICIMSDGDDICFINVVHVEHKCTHTHSSYTTGGLNL